MRTFIFAAYIQLDGSNQSSVKNLTSQPASGRPVIHWATLKGAISIIVFLAVAASAEFLLVVYAMNLGVEDKGLLKINWPLAITISPLFHLVPTAVIITLLFTWMYLTKKLSVRPLVTTGKAGAPGIKRTETTQPTTKTSQSTGNPADKTRLVPAKARRFSYLRDRIWSARTTIKSALTVFVAFLALVLLVSLLTYPTLVFQTIRNSYQSNSPLYYFVVAVANGLRSFAEVVSPVGWIAAAINNAILVIAPSIGSIGIALGSSIAPLANLDAPGKYLIFQNAAAWIAVFSVLFYGQYGRKRYRYKKK